MPVVMMMMVVVMVVMMVLVMLHHRRGGSGTGRGGFLRHGVSGEADSERGGGDEALDHDGEFLWTKARAAHPQKDAGSVLNAR